MTTQTNVPLDNQVNVTSGVVSSTRSGFIPQGLFLSKNVLIPTSTILTFTDALSVGAYFGKAEGEFEPYQIALQYFKAYEGNTSTPPSILFARYTDEATAPYTRGSALNVNVDLAILQQVTAGTLVVSFAGVTSTATGINLSTNNSFSLMASTIQTALREELPQAIVSFDTVSNAFTVSNGVDDTAVNYIVASGTGDTDKLAQRMKILQINNALLSQGTPVMTPEENMDDIIMRNTNWVGFTHAFDVSGDTDFSTMMGLTKWVDDQPKGKYAYLPYSSDPNIVAFPQSTITAPYYIATNGFGEVLPTGQIVFSAPIAFSYSNLNLVSGVLGTGCSVDYTTADAVLNFANKSYSGIIPLVTNQIQYNMASLNGCNFYARFASAANSFLWYQDGATGGIFLWLDNIYNNRWLVDSLQVAQAGVLGGSKKISFTQLKPLQASLINVCNKGVINGVIQAGNTFTPEQIAQLKQQTGGKDISSNLTQSGFYVQIDVVTAENRISRLVRDSVWYSNGSAVNKISTNTTLVI